MLPTLILFTFYSRPGRICLELLLFLTWMQGWPCKSDFSGEKSQLVTIPTAPWSHLVGKASNPLSKDGTVHFPIPNFHNFKLFVSLSLFSWFILTLSTQVICQTLDQYDAFHHHLLIPWHGSVRAQRQQTKEKRTFPLLFSSLSPRVLNIPLAFFDSC